MKKGTCLYPGRPNFLSKKQEGTLCVPSCFLRYELTP